jgi:hypothetical protein
MKDLQAHSDYIGQDDIGGQPVSDTYRNDPWKSVIRRIKNDKHNQPNTDEA